MGREKSSEGETRLYIRHMHITRRPDIIMIFDYNDKGLYNNMPMII